jgi:hypothetical protein
VLLPNTAVPASLSTVNAWDADWLTTESTVASLVEF